MSADEDMTSKTKTVIKKEPEKEVIHSGHFMVSDFEADDEDDVAIPLPDEAENSKMPPPKSGIVPKVTFKDLPISSRHELSIETSLTKIFQCMSLAYRQKLTSPKWNRFKGIRLRWKDKIRLNNVIWRCWHMQFINRKRTLVCQFASPLDIDTHNKPEAIVMEGKYWKRRLQAVTAEYKKWRMYYRNILLGKKDAHEMLFELESLEWPGSDACDLTIDDMVFMSDSLFNTITANQPYAFPDHREIAHRTSVADFIQPTLVQLQPNLDDFMDFEPFQELQAKVPLEVCNEVEVDEKLVVDGRLVSTLPEKGQSSWSPAQSVAVPPPAPPPSQIISSANYVIKKPPITTTTNVYSLFKGTVPGQFKGFPAEDLSAITVKNESREYDLARDGCIKNETATSTPASTANTLSWKDVGNASPAPGEIQSPHHVMYLGGPVSPSSPVNSKSMSPISLDLESSSPTSSVSSLPSKLYRRHVNAEQKRRCNIKNGFDILHSLLPQTSHSANTKVSKAGVLQKAVDYIKVLRAERLQLEEEIKSLRNQVEFHNNAISNCQDKLPATGAPVSKQLSTKIKDMFSQHIKIRTEENWKYWIFSLICEPLMISFSDCVSTASMDHLYSTTLQWVDQYCSLLLLRPIVLNALKRLCTSTDVLTNPESLEKEIMAAVKISDKASSTHRKC